MKTLLSVLCCLLFIMSNAQTPAFKPGTGDKELDASLTQLNKLAKADPKGFKIEMNTSFNCGNQKIEEMLVKMEPGHVFMALQIANLMSKELEKIITAQQKGRGWKQIMIDNGIAAGSAHQKTIKKNAKDKVTKMNERAGISTGGKGK